MPEPRLRSARAFTAADWVSLVQDLQSGRLIIYPTETVYGVGCSASHLSALQALREWKSTPAGKPFLVLVSGVAMAEQFGAVFSSRALELAAEYWPGPLTMVLPLEESSPLTTSGVAGDGDEIAVRVSSHPWVKELFLLCREPLVSTSFNLAGDPPAMDLPKDIPRVQAFSWVVKTATPLSQVPSTLVRVSGSTVKILRPGGIKI